MDETVQWLDEEEQETWRLLVTVETTVKERLDCDLRTAHGLTLGDYGVLVHLDEAGPEGLRMSDLAERLLLSRSGLTRRIDGLVRSGLVARQACPADGRGSLAQLTEAGRDALRAAAPTHVRGVRKYLLDPIGSLGGLTAGLERVLLALDDSATLAGRRWTEPGRAPLERAWPGAAGAGQPGSSPVTTSRPVSIQPLVPPATETAL